MALASVPTPLSSGTTALDVRVCRIACDADINTIRARLGHASLQVRGYWGRGLGLGLPLDGARE